MSPRPFDRANPIRRYVDTPGYDLIEATCQYTRMLIRLDTIWPDTASQNVQQ